MGGQAFDTLGHLAGYGVGALSALTSIKGGGLQNWLLNRQRAVEDPAIRASLLGSPFASGMLFQSEVAAPGTMPGAGAVAAPSDLAWLQQQTPARHFMPNLPPLPAETQVQTQAAQGIVSGLQSADPVVRAQAKLAGKIPLTPEETGAIIKGGKELQAGLGPGGTVGVEVPGMPVTIGSPYSVSPVGYDEFPTYGEALAAARSRGSGWDVEQTNRGTFKPVQITAPVAPPRPAVVGAGGGAPPPAAVQPSPPAHGRGVTPPGTGAINAPRATAPPPAQAAPAPRTPPSPSVQTGTPGLGAGYVQLPTPPPSAPPYAGGPYDPNAIASTPAPPQAAAPSPAPRVGYPSPAFDENAPPTPAPAAAPAAAAPEQPALPVYPAQGFVFHHSGGTTLAGLRATLGDRGLGSEYLMDRDGTIYSYAGAGSPHIQPNDKYHGIAPGLTNRNAVGMELVARDDRDVTPAQVASARNFIATNYPTTPVYGHGEVNPGHKEASEGMTVVNAIRTARGATAAPAGAGVAGPGFLTRAVALVGPSSAEAAEVPGWGPPSIAAPGRPAAPAAAAPPPSTAVPTVAAPPSGTAIVAPAPPPARGAPGLAVAPATPPGAAPVPLTRQSFTSASGQQDVYELGPPSELAADAAQAGITDFRTASPEQIDYFNQLRVTRGQREQKSTADLQRTLRPLTESEARATDFLMDKRDKLNKFYQDFPDQTERDKFVGWTRRPVLDYMLYLHNNPRFQKFVDDLAPFQDLERHTKMLDEGGVNISPGNVPTGHEPYPERFEDRLDDLNFNLNSQIYRQFALRQMSVGDLTPRWANTVQSYFDRMRADRSAAREAARAPAAPPRETPATITLAPPTTTQPPSPGRGGFTVLEDRPAQ